MRVCVSKNPYRNLPSVDVLMESAALSALNLGHALKVEAVRDVLSHAREAIGRGEDAPDADALEQRVIRLAHQIVRARFRNVINATGVMIHTNLGRAPLMSDPIASTQGYSNLEFDLVTGKRGSRRSHLEELICELSGAEAALVVNNTAAAVLLLLTARARGKEVLISRSELVEIGGSFRVPEIMEASGAILREVGTTNRTYVEDYEKAVTSNTAAILKVHRSNFRVSGFTHEATTSELVELAGRCNLPFWFDLGSATFGPLPPELPVECDVRAELSAGIDIGCFSGDKLLGGPQSGILVGKKEAIAELASHPMARALRVGKLTIKHMQDVLLAYRRGQSADVTLSAMLNVSLEELEARGRVLLSLLEEGGVSADIVPSDDPIGGGSHPDQTLPGRAVKLLGIRGVNGMAGRLRQGDVPVVCVVREGAIHLHLRTLVSVQLETLANAVILAASGLATKSGGES